MKRSGFISLFLLLSCTLYSQNYETIPVQLRSAYLLKYGADSLYKYFHPVHDTVIGNDTVYKSYRSMDDDAHAFSSAIFPWAITDTNWMGYRMIKLSSGDELFINQNLDSIHFKKNIQLNDQWIIYSYANGDYMRATLTSVAQKLILGVYDSVRTISLQRFNAASQSISDPINLIKFEISKNYGFTKLISLRHFPSVLNYYILGGVESPALGKYNADAKAIYNYNVGDIFQYERGDYSVDVFWKFYTQRTVINKQVYLGGDSIIYMILDSTLRVADYTTPTPYTTYTWFIRTDTCLLYMNTYSGQFESYLGTSADLSKLPYKVDDWGPVISDTIVFSRKSFTYNNRVRKEFHHICAPVAAPPYNYLVQCTQTVGRCGYLGASYIEGIGISGYLDNISVCTPCCYLNLVYYQKGAETWGQAFRLPLLLGTKELKPAHGPLVFPNPFETSIRVSALGSENNSLKMYDNIGNLVAEYNSEQKEIIDIQTENLASGVYFLRISNSKTVSTLKVIKL